MTAPLKHAVSLLLCAAMLAGSALLGWGTGWVFHSESHRASAQAFDAEHPAKDDLAHIQLTDAQHQLLHEVSHHPVALVPATHHFLASSSPITHLPLADTQVPSVAIAPPLRPPRRLPPL